MDVTPSDYRVKMALRDRLLSALQVAQKERPQRLDNDGSGLPEWIAYELGVMHGMVNQLREELGLPPVGIEQVEAVEQQAVGHSDYSTKFALYCAELVLSKEK